MDPISAHDQRAFVANTIAVLTTSPEHRAAWHDELEEAIETAQSAGASDHVALFQALLSLLDGEEPHLGPSHPYSAAVNAVKRGVAAAQSGARAEQVLPQEQIDTIMQNTLAVLTTATERRNEWRDQVVAALQEAGQQGEPWLAERELFQQVLAALDGERPSLAPGHTYAQQIERLATALSAADGSGRQPERHAPGLSAAQLDAITGNTIAVLTSEREQLSDWREQMQAGLRQAQEKGLRLDADFFSALLELLAGRTPTLARENPYAVAIDHIEAQIFTPQDEDTEDGEAAQRGYTIAVPVIVVEAVQALADASDWHSARQVIEERAMALMRPEAETLLSGMAAQAELAGRAQAAERMTARLAVLQACKSAGIETTFARLLDRE